MHSLSSRSKTPAESSGHGIYECNSLRSPSCVCGCIWCPWMRHGMRHDEMRHRTKGEACGTGWTEVLCTHSGQTMALVGRYRQSLLTGPTQEPPKGGLERRKQKPITRNCHCVPWRGASLRIIVKCGEAAPRIVWPIRRRLRACLGHNPTTAIALWNFLAKHPEHPKGCPLENGRGGV